MNLTWHSGERVSQIGGKWYKVHKRTNNNNHLYEWMNEWNAHKHCTLSKWKWCALKAFFNGAHIQSRACRKITANGIWCGTLAREGGHFLMAAGFKMSILLNGNARLQYSFRHFVRMSTVWIHFSSAENTIQYNIVFGLCAFSLKHYCQHSFDWFMCIVSAQQTNPIYERFHFEQLNGCQCNLWGSKTHRCQSNGHYHAETFI